MRTCFNLGAVAALLICLGCSGQASPSDWLEVGAASNEVKIYVDMRSLSSGDEWVRLDQRFTFPKGGPDALQRVDQQVVYDCRARSVRTLRSVELSNAGVESIGNSEAVPAYKIEPGTLPELVFDLVC